MTRRFFTVLIVGLILAITIDITKSMIIDGAAYYIKNHGDDMCIAPGKLDGLDSVTRGTLFDFGTPVVEICRNVTRHQWITHLAGKSSFEIASVAVARHYDKSLNANISGDFVKYFSRPVNIGRIRETNSSASDIQYSIKELQSLSCYHSQGQNKSVDEVKCDRKDPHQLWTFTLVQDPVAPALHCKSFWECSR